MRLDIKNVCHKFKQHNGRDLEVLEDVSFSVSSGDLVVVLGPSGCGKTTLLRVIAGLQSPTGGEILFDEVPSDRQQRRIGFVFQEPSLFPWLTVAENVSFSLRLGGASSSWRVERVEELLRLTGLSDFGGAFPREISMGMQQRVAIARSLAGSPEVLLLDEPFSALDVESRDGMQTFLLQILKQTGMTAVFVTHSVEEGVFLGDRVVLLSARPATVVAEERVGFSPERDSSFKRSEAFARKESYFLRQVRELT